MQKNNFGRKGSRLAYENHIHGKGYWRLDLRTFASQRTFDVDRNTAIIACRG